MTKKEAFIKMVEDLLKPCDIEELKKYFWDTQFELLDKEKNINLNRIKI